MAPEHRVVLAVRGLDDFLAQLGQPQHGDAVLVRVHASKGSTPREAGAWMAVFPQTTLLTIGGGRLELDAIGHARQLLAGNTAPLQIVYKLGASLGQCCGGEVTLAFERVCANDISTLRRQLQSAARSVAVFGAGHVGQALVGILAGLPLDVLWLDSRDDFPMSTIPAGVRYEHCQPLHSAVAALAAYSHVLIMSHSHAEDLDVVRACLERQRSHADLPFVGLIGSKTKWASFKHQLRQRGFTDSELAHITCPIGITGIADKHPAAIAVAVAAQLLMQPAVPISTSIPIAHDASTPAHTATASTTD